MPLSLITAWPPSADFTMRPFSTWVEPDPTLDVESSLEIVRETHSFVNFYKIGRANYLPITNTTDWRGYTERMIELCARLGVRHYIKRDLQAFLPPGYHSHNHMRVEQCYVVGSLPGSPEGKRRLIQRCRQRLWRVTMRLPSPYNGWQGLQNRGRSNDRLWYRGIMRAQWE